LDIVLTPPNVDTPLPGLENLAPAIDAPPVADDDPFAEDRESFVAPADDLAGDD